MKSTKFRLISAAWVRLLVIVAACSYFIPSVGAAPLTWTTAVTNSSTTTNQLRAVAVADQLGNDSIYLGYIQTTGGNRRRVNRHSTISPYDMLHQALSNDGEQPKGIATDDRGNVFVAYRHSGSSTSYVHSFNPTLELSGGNTSTVSPVVGGIAVQKSGSTYYAYTVYEEGGLVQRYDVTNPSSMTLDTTFGLAGSFIVPGAFNLRGIEVGPDGSLYIAARDDGRVYKVAADLSATSSVLLTRAMDVAIFGDHLYATSYNGANSFIRKLNLSDLSTVEDITIAALDSNPYARGANEGWGGIDIDASGRIWLADQHYGGSSPNPIQDRLLVSSSLIPEPATGILLLVGVGCFFCRVRDRH